MTRLKNGGLRLVLDGWWASVRPSVRTVFPAFVTGYDHATKLARVQPSIRKRYSDGRPLAPAAPLSERPVVQVARGGGWVITHELVPGDQVLCLAADRALDAWAGSDGTLVDPKSRRYHSAMDAIVLPGLAPAGAQTSVAPEGALYIGREDGRVSLTLHKDGSATLRAGPEETAATIEVTPEGAVRVVPAPGQRVELGGVGPNPNVARVGDTAQLTPATIDAINVIAAAAGAAALVPATARATISPNTSNVGASDA